MIERTTDVQDSNRFTRQPQRLSRPYQQPNQSQPAERWGTLRSAHATEARIFPKSIAYVLTQSGARIVAGIHASAGAVSALRRHAEAAERPEAEQITKRRRAA